MIRGADLLQVPWAQLLSEYVNDLGDGVACVHKSLGKNCDAIRARELSLITHQGSP